MPGCTYILLPEKPNRPEQRCGKEVSYYWVEEGRFRRRVYHPFCHEHEWMNDREFWEI